MAMPTSAAASAIKSLMPSPQYMHVLPSPYKCINNGRDERANAVTTVYTCLAQSLEQYQSWL